MESPSISVGSRVEIIGVNPPSTQTNSTKNVPQFVGTIRFIGMTSFALGKWIGVELDEAKGKNDGTVVGRKYFECSPNCGIFVRMNQVRLLGTGPVTAGATLSRPGTPKNLSRSSSLTPLHTPKSASLSSLTNEENGCISTSTSNSNSRGTTPRKPSISKSILNPPTKIISKRLSISKNESNISKNSNDSLIQTARHNANLESDTVITSRTPLSRSSARLSNSASLSKRKASMDSISESMTKKVIIQKSGQELASVPVKDSIIPSILSTLSASELCAVESPDTPSTTPKTKSPDQNNEFNSLSNTTSIDQQKQLNQLQARLCEAMEHIEQLKRENEALVMDYSETNELLSVEKAFAEEKADVLSQQLESYQDRIDDMTLDIQVLQEENAIFQEESIFYKVKMALWSLTPSEQEQTWMKMLTENSKLKKALLHCRHVIVAQEDDLKTFKSQYQNAKVASEEIETMKNTLKEREQVIQELKLSLEASLSSEVLVHQLTEKNLDLADRVDVLLLSVKEMETLNELNELIDVQRAENELELMQVVDAQKDELAALLMKMENYEETLVDYQRTMMHLREIVHQAQEMNRDKKTQDTDQNKQMNRELLNQTNAAFTLSHQQSLLSKMLDLELRKYHLVESQKELALVSGYLPGRFFEEDELSIKVLLSFDRFSFKIGLLIKWMDENQFQQTTKKRSLYLLKPALLRLQAKFVELIHFYDFSCSVSDFLELARWKDDLCLVEKKLEGLFDLLKQDDDSDAEENIEKMLAHLEHLFRHFQSENTEMVRVEKLVTAEYVMQVVGANVAVLENEWDFFMTFLTKKIQTSLDIDASAEKHPIQALLDSWTNLPLMMEQNRKFKVKCNHLRRTMHQFLLLQTPSHLPKKAMETHAFTLLENMASILSQCVLFTRCFVDGATKMDPVDSQVFVKQCEKLVFTSSEDYFQPSEMEMGASYLKCFANLETLADSLMILAQNEKSYVDIASNGRYPIEERAIIIKEAYDVNLELEVQVKKANEEQVKTTKELKQKEITMKELLIKIDLLENKLETAKRQSTETIQLKQELESTKQNSKLYEDAVTSLHSDLEELENENEQLRWTAKKLEQELMHTKTLLPSHSGPGSKNTSPRTSNKDKGAQGDQENVMHSEVNGILLEKLDALDQVIRLLKMENQALQQRKMRKDWQKFIHCTSFLDETDSRTTEKIDLESDFRQLKKALRRTLLNQSGNNSRADQGLVQLKCGYYDLEEKMMRLAQSTKQDFPALYCGKLTIPYQQGCGSKEAVVLEGRSDLHRIHQAMMA